MKKMLFVLGLSLALFSCKENSASYPQHAYQSQPVPQVVVEPASNFGDGLDLQSLGELVKTSNSAADIENKLNQPNSINNLDLDENGEVDYIKVSEYGSGNSRGFSFSIDAPDGSKQDIANVDVTNAGQQVNMNIQGNQQLYGAPVSYQSSFSASDVILMHYLFSYHRPYYSPYHYGYYPSYYRPYRSVGHSTYRTRTYSTTRTTYKRSNPYNNTRTYSNSKSYSPKYANKSKNSYNNSAYKRSSTLSAPTKSQKSFNVTSREKSRPNTSGFSNNSRKSSSYSSPSRKSSGSSFGSSYKSKPSSSSSSYGGSSRKSSSSFGSSSRSSSSRSSFGSSSRSSSSRRR